MIFPPLVPLGDNPTPIWGMSTRERLRRIADAQGFTLAEKRGAGAALLVDLDYVFDPLWLTYVAARPGVAILRGGVPVIAHVTADRSDPHALDAVQQETTEIENHALRKRDRAFMEKLTPESVGLIERASYQGAYKGVTDVLTKYMWPEWALQMTRIAARWGITPNQVTTIGALFCVIATWCFFTGDYWPGLAAGLLMMILDTVDGKLARCTITSSSWGNIFDHGMDLVHPPFWWYGWGVGLAAYGRPLSDTAFLWCMAAILGGYIVQRIIEGIFMGAFGIHVHVWRRFDSQFRLFTARRNPNMVILTALLVIGRPDWGLIAVAGWTILSLAVHFVQLVQALAARAQGRPVRSWLG